MTVRRRRRGPGRDLAPKTADLARNECPTRPRRRLFVGGEIITKLTSKARETVAGLSEIVGSVRG